MNIVDQLNKLFAEWPKLPCDHCKVLKPGISLYTLRHLEHQPLVCLPCRDKHYEKFNLLRKVQ